MKRILKIILVVAGSLLFICAVGIGAFIYTTEYRISDVATFSSEDNQYKVTFQMVGDPDWPFGDTTARVKVMKLNENGKEVLLEKFTTTVSNDGKTLGTENCYVKWQSEKVLIILTGEEQEDATYEIALE